jgi:hypothetical protein
MTSQLPGVVIRNAADDQDFTARPIRHRNVQSEREAYLRMAHLFLSDPTSILQELVNISITLCEAESAGISLKEGNEFRWIVTAGRFAPFRDNMLPEDASPCGICLKRNQPQLFDVDHPYYQFLGIEGPPFQHALLIPWRTDDTEGTLWVIPPAGSPGFDFEDLRLLKSFADMAALCVQLSGQQRRLRDNDLAIAGAVMANSLAHQINNPLQGLTNTLYLASQTHPEPYLAMALVELHRISALVEQLLALPKADPS